MNSAQDSFWILLKEDLRQSEKLSEIKPPLGILFTTKHLHDSKKSCNCYHVMKKITMDIFLHDLNNGLC